MDIIQKAIDEIKFRIPREILKLAYMEKRTWSEAPVSLDEMIRRKTIHARVIVDTNIAGGDTVIIDLKGLTPYQMDVYNYVFEIPGSLVNFRTIMAALSINYMTYTASMNTALQNMTSGTPNGINSMSSAAHRAMDSRSNIPIISNAECYVVGHNTVLVRNHLITAGSMQLRCVLANDENLNNLSIRLAPQFSQLCTLAAKSFIYNELLVKLDKGYLERGQELGIIKTYIDGLSDAEEMYQTYLREEWGVVGIINDRLTHEDLIKLQIDPGI